MTLHVRWGTVVELCLQMTRHRVHYAKAWRHP